MMTVSEFVKRLDEAEKTGRHIHMLIMHSETWNAWGYDGGASIENGIPFMLGREVRFNDSEFVYGEVWGAFRNIAVDILIQWDFERRAEIYGFPIPEQSSVVIQG